jgi:hypothetical protein
MAVRYKDHGRVPVDITVVLSGLDQPFDLRLGQVLPRAQILVGRPFRSNCSINDSWRDQPQVRLRHVFRAPGIDDCSNNGLCFNSKASAAYQRPIAKPARKFADVPQRNGPKFAGHA